jgi:hypothetical protein
MNATRETLEEELARLLKQREDVRDHELRKKIDARIKALRQLLFGNQDKTD